jgi:hypothetical protein
MLYESEKIRNIIFWAIKAWQDHIDRSLASLAFKTPKGSIDRKNTISVIRSKRKTASVPATWPSSRSNITV